MSFRLETKMGFTVDHSNNLRKESSKADIKV